MNNEKEKAKLEALKAKNSSTSKDKKSGVVTPEDIRPEMMTSPAKSAVARKLVDEKPKITKVVFRNDVLDKKHYKAGHIYDIPTKLYNRLKSVPSAVDHSKSLILGYKGKLKPLTRNPKVKG